jgi:hypothetical protein
MYRMVGFNCKSTGGGRGCWFDRNGLILPGCGRKMKRSNPQAEDYDEILNLLS